MIGNPHGLAGTFYDAFHKNRKQFHTVHISAFDTPAFTEAGITAENIADLEYPDPVTDTDVIPADNTVIPADAGTQGKTNHANSRIPYGLSTPRWALRLFNSHGPQSSVYQTRVAGQFPSEANDTLIPLRDIEAAVKRPHVVQPDDKPIVGLDIARFGDDKTVIIVRHGMRVLHIEELRKSDLVNTTGRVITVADEFKVRHVMIDEVGIGAGVLDTLKQDKKFITTGINGGSRSDDPNKYGNLRAQIFDGLRQRFADGQISIPNDPELISQLASLTYRYNARGQLLLESKEIIKGHGRQSPDKADALAYAFAEHRATKHEWGIITYTPKTLARLRQSTTPRPQMARLTPPHPHSPHVIPADAGNQGKTKHAVSLPPFATAKGTRAQHAGDARNSPQHPITQQHVPSPLVQPVGAVREPPLPPPSPKHPHPQQPSPLPRAIPLPLPGGD